MNDHNADYDAPVRCDRCGQWGDIHGGPNQGVHALVQPTASVISPAVGEAGDDR